MKKFVMLLVAGLFVLGCGSGHKGSGTCPHKKAADKPAENQPADKNLRGTDSKTSVDTEEPEVTGYGQDPGEETQE